MSGLVNAAAGALSSLRPRQRSKKGPAALALAAGAASIAVAKRRRSAEANEPIGQAFSADEQTPGAQDAVAERSPEQPTTTPDPDAEESSAEGVGGARRTPGTAR